MLLFLISIFFCLIFLWLLSVIFTKKRVSEQAVIIFVLLSAYIVIVLEFSSLFNQLNNPFIVLGVQLFILGLTGLAVRLFKLNLPKRIDVKQIKSKMMDFYSILSKNKLITIFSLFILSGYLIQIIVAIKFPQNTIDALYNHLSRIGYWLQQGSLKPYDGFNIIGSTYPYINSLLMLWPIIFIKSDVLVGFVQLFSSFAIAFTIFEFSCLFGFSRKSSLLTALTFLTFPVVILQSTTAQNDLLVAAYIGIAFLFMIKFFTGGTKFEIILSSLAMALAIGTKQYAFFVLPGYFGLLFYYLMKFKTEMRRHLSVWIVSILGCSIAFGMYAYFQNLLYFGTFFGGNGSNNSTVNELITPNIFLRKLSLNSARLFTQFISCEGLPITIEKGCWETKANLLSRFFVRDNFNIESGEYLLEIDTPFIIGERYSLNEESSWFGIASWVLVLPGVVIGFFFFLRQKRFDILFLLLTSVIHFAITSFFQRGWGPYMGRYLIVSIALIMPFTASLFSSLEKLFVGRFFTFLYCFCCTLIMVSSIVNNNSRPVVGKSQLINIQQWGKENSILFQKIAYKVTPFVENWYSIWQLSDVDIKTRGSRHFRTPLVLVENYVPENSSLGVIAKEGFVMDYLFFGDNFSRKITAITEINNLQVEEFTEEFLLLSPDFSIVENDTYRFVIENDGWIIYRRMK
jgi:hypothetical protein